MELIIPDAVRQVLAEFEDRQQVFLEYELTEVIQKAASSSRKLNDAECHGVLAEMNAFQFMKPAKEPRDPWDSVFAPPYIDQRPSAKGYVSVAHPHRRSGKRSMWWLLFDNLS